jgi:hypothetical protein
MIGRTIRTLAALAVTAAVLGLAVPAGAASRRQTWQLEDYAQTACFDTNSHNTWYGIYIHGRWQHAIDVGARRLPAGSAVSTSYAPIAPGSSTGELSLAYVEVTVRDNLPVGTYTAYLWASDGTAVDRVLVTLDVQPDCGY